MKSFLFVLLLSSVPFPAQSALIIKINNNQALVHLEGLKTKKGAYFEVLDLYGDTKGLVKVKRVGNKKAVFSLILGKMKYKWSLEPKSKKWARSKIKRYKTALLQKQKRKRRPVAQKKRKRRPVAQKKRKTQRQVASYAEGEEFLINDNELNSNYAQNNYSNNSDAEELATDYTPTKIAIGLQPKGTFNFIIITPPKTAPIKMTGLGFGGNFFIETPVNNFLSTQAHFGFEKFAAKSQNKCGKSKKCALEINYLTTGITLKGNLLSKDLINLSLGVDGTLYYPIEYRNQANLSENSFGFHGTLGVSFETKLSLGNVIIPINLNLGLIIPPTATTLVAISSLNLGIGFKF